MLRRVVLVFLAILMSSSLVACSSTKPDSCGPVVRDPLDPGSGTHVLPGAPTPSYLIDPPTSGAHQPSPPVTGLQKTPIALPIQIGILEEGHVLIQYRGLSPRDVDRLAQLVSDDVVVAPAASLPTGSRVVATAWVTHQSCRALDLDTMRDFARDHAGKGPGH